ncbi:SMI1/KNR4 family protein [Sporosarcina sp. P17b]|uniref:SMI1/KNR4 family protein n=1 Tax=Sporosarcina sp. P17b TaxID=2048260 RepID=UPI000C16A1F0|nr:SMI1/KNR4 family protein [Sporosarcina sp. P17b]PIC73746.1 SMI1/KNR4 family protein [Sporosarcina sp. P17b]
MHFITKSLDTLKNRLGKNGEILIYGEKGNYYEGICSFDLSAEDNEILYLEKENGIKLPEDYRMLLNYSNGIKLFQVVMDNINIGGGLELFSLNEIQENAGNVQHPYLPIGYLSENYLSINMECVKNNQPNYLYHCSFLEAIPLNLNLELFVDRYIISQGSNFWDWPIYTADNFYKFDE